MRRIEDGSAVLEHSLNIPASLARVARSSQGEIIDTYGN